jgi:hypothetical protein
MFLVEEQEVGYILFDFSLQARGISLDKTLLQTRTR